jgi:GAF domain-containing protein
LQRVSDLVAQLPQWQQTMRQDHDELTLATTCCGLLTAIDGYRIVRIGLRAPDQPDLPDQADLPDQPIDQWAEQRAEGVPTGDDVALDDAVANQMAHAVLEAGEPVVIDDMLAAPAYTAWHAAAHACGIRAVIGLTLRWEEQPLGVMLVMAAASDLFDNTTSAILNHLAATLAYGLAVRRGLLPE